MAGAIGPPSQWPRVPNGMRQGRPTRGSRSTTQSPRLLLSVVLVAVLLAGPVLPACASSSAMPLLGRIGTGAVRFGISETAPSLGSRPFFARRRREASTRLRTALDRGGLEDIAPEFSRQHPHWISLCLREPHRRSLRRAARLVQKTDPLTLRQRPGIRSRTRLPSSTLSTTNFTGARPINVTPPASPRSRRPRPA